MMISRAETGLSERGATCVSSPAPGTYRFSCNLLQIVQFISLGQRTLSNIEVNMPESASGQVNCSPWPGVTLPT